MRFNIGLYCIVIVAYNLGDIALLDVLLKLAVVHFARGARSVITEVESQQHHRNDGVEPIQVESGPEFFRRSWYVVTVFHSLFVLIYDIELVQVGNFIQFGICPEVFQIVELTGFG